MKSKEELEALFEFAKIQEGMGNVKKEVWNDYYKSYYRDLDTILSKLKPLLKKYDFVLEQNPVNVGSMVGAETIFTYKNGVEIKATLTFPLAGKNLAQNGGGAISYSCRYALIRMLLIEDKSDNDGNDLAQPTVTDIENDKKKEIISLLKDFGLVDEEAKLYARNEINKGVSIDQLVSRLTDFQNDGYRWDIISKQFLKK